MTSHMIDGPYAAAHDARDRRPDYPSQPYSLPPGSPPSSSSPFAFNSPSVSNPNSSRTATTMPSEQVPVAADYYQRPAAPGAAPAGGASYPNYGGSHPMTYRSNSETTRAPPPAPLTRVPTYAMMQQQPDGVGQPSPTATSPYYQASPRGPGGPYAAGSPRTPAYSQGGYYSPGYSQAPQALDMPRSLSYPNYASNPYTSYLPSISTPTLLQPGEQLPPLARQHSTNSINTLGQPMYGGQYGSRLPLQDRPFKCDQCIQSFNRNHDLKRHKRIHLAVKPFQCEKCGKSFSRKDALRRHWMVRGCRGEEGATAPITPAYPLNNPPPALSPSTPPANSDKSTPAGAKPAPSGSLYGSNTMSFSHPSAPPPLTSLPPRQSSDQPSQIILTPNDMAAQQRSASDSSNNGESVVIDPALSMEGGAFGGSASAGPDGDKSYFELMRKQNSMGGAVPDSAVSSTFSRYGASPKDDAAPARHHPYRRAGGPLPSPSMHSPLAQSFAHQQQSNPNLLAPINSSSMSKQSSADSGSDPQWGSQRW